MSSDEIYSDLLGVTEKVFAEMIFTKVKGHRMEEGKNHTQDNLTGMVGFGGSITGLVSVQCTDNGAAAIAAKMLYTDEASLSQEDIRDAIGEITNMIAGGYKAIYAEKNHNGELVLEQTVPTVISGKDFETYVLGDAHRYSTIINFEGYHFMVELWIRGN